jgi:hypothetical protein
MHLGLLVCAGAVLFLAGCSTTENISLGPAGAPLPVLEAFNKTHPDAKIVDVRKKVYKDGSMKYNIEYKDAVGKSHDVNYDERGTMVK